MRERVEELGRGDFKTNMPKIEISTSTVEINLNVDEYYEGFFSLKSLNSNKMKGMVYTSTQRMQCMNSQFIGTESKILFRFYSKGICEGKSIKGNFYIICNGGEFCLPFVVTVNKKEIISSLGKINNLFHFTNLAASNWNEAFQVFQTPEFRAVFVNNDRRYENMYLALTSGEKVTEQCMEEFLIGIQKKKPVYIQMNEAHREFYELSCDEKESILLSKNTWGYVDIKASSDCDFIELNKQVITTNDFIGSTYSLEYIVKKNKLHAGRNYGAIKISSVNGESMYEIMVTTRAEEAKDVKRSQRKEKKNNLFALMNLYLSYRYKKTNTNPWAKECMGYVNALIDMEPDNKQYKLFRTQLLIIQKKNYEAFEVLKEYESSKKELKEDNKLYVYYLYLTTFSKRDAKHLNKVMDEVKGIYQKNKVWQILWVLLNLEHHLQTDYASSLYRIEEQYLNHGYSPIMYVEAFRIIKSDVFLLQKLGKFEIQVLLWAVKKQVLSKEVILQVSALTTKIKVFHSGLFQILTYGYEQYNEKEILSAICKLLIYGNKTQEQYFKWYNLGVEQDIRITRLYEYYMYSIPMDYNENIPKTILMYFGYYNNLDYKKSALLYERVIKQRDIYPDIFQSYRRNMEEFMLEQLMRKRNNEKLAFIYDTMLTLNSITKDHADAISNILFGCELYCDNPKIKSVSVVHKHLKQESIYPLIDKKAYIHLYTRDYAISFLDGEGNRYFGSFEYYIKNLMDEAFYIKKCYELDVEDKNIRFHIVQNLIDSNLLTSKELKLLSAFLTDDEMKENYKGFLRGVIINYCCENEEDELIHYITDMDFEEVDCFWRTKVVECLIIKGLYQKAFEIIIKYGYEDISVKQLMKLISRLIPTYDFEKENTLLALAIYVFKERKYDDIILKYLVLYYDGTLNQMKDIWSASYKFDVDAFELAERIILQLLFTNEYIEEIDDIFDYYYSRGAKSQIAQAFLTYYAFRYLVMDKKVGPKTFEYIRREEYVEGLQNDTCKLAMLKHYAKRQNLSVKEQEYVESTLETFMVRNMYFKFYEDFKEELLEPYCYDGKHLVEYKSDTKEDILIHYIQEDLDGNGEYRVEKMNQSYPGIYSKLFTVFYGEKIRYYITEKDNATDLVKNDIIIKNEMNLRNSVSRYNLLNDMSVAKEMNDDATLLELMNRYAINSQVVEELYKSM